VLGDLLIFFGVGLSFDTELKIEREAERRAVGVAFFETPCWLPLGVCGEIGEWVCIVLIDSSVVISK
jgi:hypothetical protein